jgi:signal transduction histidine kinase
MPVPRQACLGRARAVLADTDDPARWLALAGDDAAVQAWLASCAVPAVAHGNSSAEDAGRVLVLRLADDFVVGPLPDGVPAAPGATAAGPSAEALLLVESIARMRAYVRLTCHFAESLQIARLEAARELAYGAGHEINNPLANIATRAQSLLLDERDAERRRRLAAIVDQSFRARDMIGGLMLFARPPKPAPDDADVDALLAAAAGAVAAVAEARGVRCEVRQCAEPLVAFVDRGQVEDALRAIVTNSVEATADGGAVAISAAAAAADPLWCEITVVDHGAGMDDATIRRAFDPFFSGHEAGRGAGLGLSKAWRFIEASGGTVALTSRVGVGTAVTVRLPRSMGRKAPLDCLASHAP